MRISPEDMKSMDRAKPESGNRTLNHSTRMLQNKIRLGQVVAKSIITLN